MDAASSVEIAKHGLLLVGLVLAFGTLTSLLASKLKVPDVALFLVAGLLLGPDASGLISVKAESTMNQLILIFGACYILFDGGATIRFKVLKQVWITLVVIATLGVMITAGIVGLAASYILGIPLIVALLLGATLASTDPATLVPIFKQVKVRDRVAQTVLSESAFNDACGAIMTFAVLGVAMGTDHVSIGQSLGGLLWQAGFGIVAGGVLGWLAALLIAHEKWDFLSEYAPVITLMAVIGAYMGADGLHASGFMAVFVFGMMLGNKDAFGFRMEPGEEKHLEEFIGTTTMIMRMFIFILLGSQVNFALMHQYLWGGVLVALVLMFVARPITVFACAGPDRRASWSLEEMLFMCWTRETGVIPAALAGLLVGMHAPGADMIASVTFIAVLMTILIQAPTTRWLGARLGLLE